MPWTLWLDKYDVCYDELVYHRPVAGSSCNLVVVSPFFAKSKFKTIYKLKKVSW